MDQKIIRVGANGEVRLDPIDWSAICGQKSGNEEPLA